MSIVLDSLSSPHHSSSISRFELSHNAICMICSEPWEGSWLSWGSPTCDYVAGWSFEYGQLQEILSKDKGIQWSLGQSLSVASSYSQLRLHREAAEETQCLVSERFWSFLSVNESLDPTEKGPGRATATQFQMTGTCRTVCEALICSTLLKPKAVMLFSLCSNWKEEMRGMWSASPQLLKKVFYFSYFCIVFCLTNSFL